MLVADGLVARAVIDDEVRQAAARVTRDGIAEIESYFAVPAIAEARDRLVATVCETGPANVGSVDRIRGTGLADHLGSDALRSLCHAVCRDQGIDVPFDADARGVVRCLVGSAHARESYYFHFDSYHLTALAPIEIPTQGNAGDLLLFPNLRPRRDSYLVNAAEKFVADRWIVQRTLRHVVAGSRRLVRMRLKPGSLYLFNGDVSLHANERCDIDAMRATLLFHFSETHRDHWIKRLRRRCAA